MSVLFITGADQLPWRSSEEIIKDRVCKHIVFNFVYLDGTGSERDDAMLRELGWSETELKELRAKTFYEQLINQLIARPELPADRLMALISPPILRAMKLRCLEKQFLFDGFMSHLVKKVMTAEECEELEEDPNDPALLNAWRMTLKVRGWSSEELEELGNHAHLHHMLAEQTIHKSNLDVFKWIDTATLRHQILLQPAAKPTLMNLILTRRESYARLIREINREIKKRQALNPNNKV